MRIKIIITILVTLVVLLGVLFFAADLPIWSKCGSSGWNGHAPDCECFGLKSSKGFLGGDIKCVGIRTQCYLFSPLHTESVKYIGTGFLYSGGMSLKNNPSYQDLKDFVQASLSNLSMNGGIYTGRFKMGQLKTETYQICKGSATEQTCEDATDTMFDFNVGINCDYYNQHQ